ncbi:MAG TPA: M12 family metallopeptidase [Chthoniobacterales bacterium]
MHAGLYVNTISPGNVPWPGGVVPYVFDSALSAAQQQTYLNALHEYELAANVHFIPRTSEAQYILFKYDPNGFDQVSGSNPQVVSVSSLTRSQICHEMGHSFGLLHEHTRPDQTTYVNVLTANISAGNQHWFNIDPNGTAQGPYDFESVMHFRRDLFSMQPAVLDTLQAKPGFEKFQPRMDGLALSKGDRAVMKFLYGAGPTLSPVVTNTGETGVGSLRAAMDYAVDNPGTTISFNIPTSDRANGVFTIRPTGHLLPLVVDSTIIDGTTQPGYAGSPLIVLDGSQILPEAEAVPNSIPGMFMYAANCTVKGLSIERFPWVGMAFLYSDCHNNTVRGCWFGLDYTGTASAPNQFQGIQISSGANSNTIGSTTDHNVISGNAQYGIWISDATTTGNVVLGNYIGTSANGLAALPNGLGGLIVTGSSTNNLIGGTSVGARNVISGNLATGVWLIGTGVNQNTVRGNYIGLAATGNAAVPNETWGVYIREGAQNNLVADNVISGNGDEGLRIENAGTSGNVVQGNQVGTASGGSSAIGNGFAGVTIYNGATGNIIGGTTAAQRNILSGNGTVGLAFGDSGTSGNIAEGNFIGTDATGTTSVGNGFAGVYLTNGANANQLGGAQPETGNLISGNAGYGVFVADPGTNGNLIRGNFIGTNAADTSALANAYSGIVLQNGAHDNVIGGDAIGAGNVIAYNASDGVTLFDAPTIRNAINQNSIFSNGSGITLNGSNHSQAAPAITMAAASTNTNPNGTDVGGNLTGANGATFRIEFFANPGAEDQGQIFIGSMPLTITANPTSFTAPLAAAVPPGYAITATAIATNGATTTGDTSPFSLPFIVPAFFDNDHDGMPDNWELNHSLNTSVNDANADKDGDGMTNIQEYKAGTDPNNASSTFRISSIVPISGNYQISFPSVLGKTYRLEYRDNLITGNWAPLVDGIFGTGSSTIQILDSGAGDLTRRFYRLTLEP